MEQYPNDQVAVSGALRHLSHGVYVLGTRRGRETNAMTASRVTQVSEHPPYVLVSVRKDRYTHDLLLESATFSLSILRDDQVNVATHFADTSGEYDDKLLGVPYALTPGGSPHLIDCIAYLDCKVIDTLRIGDYTVVVGEVMSGETLDENYPLLYDPSEYEGVLN